MKAKSRISVMLIAVMIVVMIIGLIGCDDQEQPQVVTKTITFNSNGGSQVKAITGAVDSDIVAPTNPTKEGYNFKGWYEDNETFEKEYAFSKMPNKDLTLYAKWEKIVTDHTHAWAEWELVTEPTEELQGAIKRKCSSCDEVENAALDKIGTEGAYTIEVILAPTCEKVGKTKYTSTKYTKISFEKETAKLEHALSGDVTVTKAPTLEVEGKATRKCSLCKKDIEIVLPKLADKEAYDKEVVEEATCQKTGKVKYTLKIDTKVTFDVTIDKISHNLGVWTITTKPTFDKAGAAERSCSYQGCTYKEKMDLPILSEEAYTKVTTKKAVCGGEQVDQYILKENEDIKVSVSFIVEHDYVQLYDEMRHWKLCTKCGKVIEIGEHTFVPGDNGEVCSGCGYKNGDAVNMLPVTKLEKLYNKNKSVLDPQYDYKLGTLDEYNGRDADYFIDLKAYPNKVLFQKWAGAPDTEWEIAIIETNAPMDKGEGVANGLAILIENNCSLYELAEAYNEEGDMKVTLDGRKILQLKDNGILNITENVTYINEQIFEAGKIGEIKFNGENTGYNERFTLTKCALYYNNGSPQPEILYLYENGRIEGSNVCYIKDGVEWVITNELQLHTRENLTIYSTTDINSYQRGYSTNAYILSEEDPNNLVENKGINKFWHFDTDNETPIIWEIDAKMGEEALELQAAANGYDGLTVQLSTGKFDFVKFGNVPTTEKAVAENIIDVSKITKQNYRTEIAKIPDIIISAKSVIIESTQLGQNGEKLDTISYFTPYSESVYEEGKFLGALYFNQDMLIQINGDNYQIKNYYKDAKTCRIEEMKNSMQYSILSAILQEPIVVPVGQGPEGANPDGPGNQGLDIKYVSNSLFTVELPIEGQIIYAKLEIQNSSVKFTIAMDKDYTQTFAYINITNFNGYVENKIPTTLLARKDAEYVINAHILQEEGLSNEYQLVNEFRMDEFTLPTVDDRTQRSLTWFMDIECTIPFELEVYKTRPYDLIVYAQLGEVAPATQVQIYIDGKEAGTIEGYNPEELMNSFLDFNRNYENLEWFIDKECTTPFEDYFKNEIPAALYAKSPQKEMMYNLDYYIGDQMIAGTTINSNQIEFNHPTYHTNELKGYYYIDTKWYLEPECITLFDQKEFENNPRDLILYGKWTTAVPSVNVTIVATDGEMIEKVYDDDRIPNSIGAIFYKERRVTGWFTDQAYTTPFDVQAFMANKQDVTVYVQYAEVQEFVITIMEEGTSFELIYNTNSPTLDLKYGNEKGKFEYYIDEAMKEIFNEQEYLKNPSNITIYRKFVPNEGGNQQETTYMITVLNLNDEIVYHAHYTLGDPGFFLHPFDNQGHRYLYYIDKECKNEFIVEKYIKNPYDIKIYQKVGEIDPNAKKITLYINGKEDTSFYFDLTMANIGEILPPAEGGWFKDPDYKTPFDAEEWQQKPTDITLYAKGIKK